MSCIGSPVTRGNRVPGAGVKCRPPVRRNWRPCAAHRGHVVLRAVDYQLLGQQTLGEEMKPAQRTGFIETIDAPPTPAGRHRHHRRTRVPLCQISPESLWRTFDPTSNRSRVGIAQGGCPTVGTVASALPWAQLLLLFLAQQLLYIPHASGCGAPTTVTSLITYPAPRLPTYSGDSGFWH